MDLRARNTDNREKTERNWTVFTNAFSAHAAPLRAHHTGGTAINTLDLPSFCNHTDGSPIPVISERRNERKLWTTA